MEVLAGENFRCSSGKGPKPKRSKVYPLAGLGKALSGEECNAHNGVRRASSSVGKILPEVRRHFHCQLEGYFRRQWYFTEMAIKRKFFRCLGSLQNIGLSSPVCAAKESGKLWDIILSVECNSLCRWGQQYCHT